MPLDAKVPSGPIESKWQKHKFDMKLVNPANKRKHRVIVVGTGLAGGAAAASLGELGLRRPELLLPGHAPPRALDRRAGRHQRREELPERRRLGAAPVLRHHQGRRLPRPRGERLPPRRGVGEHHRSVRRPGRAVRPRVRRRAREPLLRRCARLPHVLRARSDRAAAPARRLPGAAAAGGGWHGEAVRPLRDARPHRRRGPRARHRRARPRHRQRLVLRRRCGRPRNRRLRQRLLPVDERQGLERHRDLACPPQGRVLREPLLHADPPDLHPEVGRLPVEAHADERVAPQRRARLGAEVSRATSGRRTRSPSPTATTTSSGSTRPTATSRRATSPPARRRTSATRGAVWAPAAWASTWTSATPSSGSAGRSWTSATGTCSRCTSGSPARTRTTSRCASTPPSTTRWAASGWTTTSCRTSPACSSGVRRTSRITARTGSARARSCRGSRTATSSCPTRSATTSPAAGSRRSTPRTRP